MREKERERERESWFSQLTKKDEFDRNTVDSLVDVSLQIFVKIIPKPKQVSTRASVNPVTGLSPISSRRGGREMGQVIIIASLPFYIGKNVANRFSLW